MRHASDVYKRQVLTFRKVRPRQMVEEHLRAALETVAQTVNRAMWLWALQLLVRLALALALWACWFLLAS